MNDPEDNARPPKARDPSDDAAGSTPATTARRHFMVHLVRAPGTVSEADRAQAKAILEREFGDYERFRKSLPKDPPATRPSKTIPVWTAGAKRPIDLIGFLTEVAGDLGYEPIGRIAEEDKNHLGFRANWSSPSVEHFIDFGSSGRPNQSLQARVGLRHSPADAFAKEERLAFLPEAYREIYGRLPPWFCYMDLDLGQASGWGEWGRLDLAEFSLLDLAQRIASAVRAQPVADITKVRHIEALFELGVQDKEPFRWLKGGDTARVAMVAYLGRKLERDADELRSTLVPHVAKFKSPPDTSEPSAEAFVDRVLDDADVALAAG